MMKPLIFMMLIGLIGCKNNEPAPQESETKIGGAAAAKVVNKLGEILVHKGHYLTSFGKDVKQLIIPNITKYSDDGLDVSRLFKDSIGNFVPSGNFNSFIRFAKDSFGNPILKLAAPNGAGQFARLEVKTIDGITNVFHVVRESADEGAKVLQTMAVAQMKKDDFIKNWPEMFVLFERMGQGHHVLRHVLNVVPGGLKYNPQQIKFLAGELLPMLKEAAKRSDEFKPLIEQLSRIKVMSRIFHSIKDGTLAKQVFTRAIQRFPSLSRRFVAGSATASTLLGGLLYGTKECLLQEISIENCKVSLKKAYGFSEEEKIDKQLEEKFPEVDETGEIKSNTPEAAQNAPEVRESNSTPVLTPPEVAFPSAGSAQDQQ